MTMLQLPARHRRQAIRLGSVLALLFAVMPQVLYLGHPLPADSSAVQGTSTGHGHHDRVVAEHANHCHVGPKGCAAADSVVHAARLSDVISISGATDAFLALEGDEPIQSFVLWQRPEKPPQPV
jgi:hypothetical protein